MTANEGSSGVSDCYVFKSRLQEYAQKVGLTTPVYETIKEGPSHEPFFKSTVIVNGVRYDSLLGFYNRKAAEQSAAEVALVELAKSSGDNKECISVPVHETGLCKNLLQEYAQKMNYAIPLYECRRDDTPGRMTLFTCTVEIGGMRYIGAAARNKKEAEIKAARTALLAIQSISYGSTGANSQLTVLPGKKREIELVKKSAEIPSALKPKKARCKNKKKTQRPNGKGRNNFLAESAGIPGSDITGLVALAMNQTVPTEIQATSTLQQLGTESMMNPEVEVTDVNGSVDVSAVEVGAQLGMDSVMKPEAEVSNGELQPPNGQSLASNDDQSNHDNPNGQAPDLSNPDIHEEANNAGEAVKSNEDQSNHSNLNGQTLPMACEDLSNIDTKNAKEVDIGDTIKDQVKNAEEVAMGDTVKDQVAAEAVSAMAGLEQSGASIEAGAD